MEEWIFAQTDPAQQLAKLHFFSLTKSQPGGEIEFVITVKEFARPRDLNMRFFALADKQTNPKAGQYTPSGWGDTLIKALSECVQAVERFPYEGP